MGTTAPNIVHIIIQSKDDPKNLLSTNEKAAAFQDGLTVVFIEGATTGGQIGIELILKTPDANGNKIIVGFGVTENNWEALMGAFIGVRMRFGRMPADQWEMVRHYTKNQILRFLETLNGREKETIQVKIKKFFNIHT